jgi:Clp amino terminal domain, pathogenicity island component
MTAISLQELIATVENRAVGEKALARLEAAAAMSEELGAAADALLSHFVVAAREDGASWTQIGGALGVSKQGAQQRFTGRADVAALIRRGSAVAATQIEDPWLQRFTPRARRSIGAAAGEAKRLNHAEVETEHLLLGLLSEPQGVAVKVLDLCGHSAAAVRAAVEAGVQPGAEPVAGHGPFTPRARYALDLTMSEALRLGHNYIGTEHILLGLMREQKGIAAQTLRGLGLTRDQLAEKTLELLADVGKGD